MERGVAGVCIIKFLLDKKTKKTDTWRNMRLFFAFLVCLCALHAQTLTWTTPTNSAASNLIVQIDSASNISSPMKWTPLISLQNPTNASYQLTSFTSPRGFFTAKAVFYNIGSYSTQDIAFEWEPASNSVDVTGYKIYFGQTSSIYSGVVAVGRTNAAVVSNVIGKSFFVMSSLNKYGLESEKTEEISYESPRMTNIVAQTLVKLNLAPFSLPGKQSPAFQPSAFSGPPPVPSL